MKMNLSKSIFSMIILGALGTAAHADVTTSAELMGIVVLKSDLEQRQGCRTTVGFNLVDNLLTLEKRQFEKCEHNPDNSKRTYLVRTVSTTVGTSYTGVSLEDPTFRVKLSFNTLKKTIYLIEENDEILTQASIKFNELN